MKLIKGLLITVAITSVLAFMGVDAGSMTYSDIKIPALRFEYYDGDYPKTNDTIQTLYTIDARDSWDWNDTRAVQARVKHMDGASYTSDWVDAQIKKTVNFGKKSKEAGLYRILLKAKRSTTSQVRYWGTWVY